MSVYALDTKPEVLDVNGRVSWREKLFVDGFETSDVEQFSEVFDMRLFSKAVFHVLNLGKSNAAKYTFYGAIDPAVKWSSLPNAVEVVLAAEASEVKTLSDAYSFVRVGVVSDVLGLETEFQVFVEGKSR